VLPPVARAAEAIGLTVHSSPQLLDLVDHLGGRGLAVLFQRLARVLTDAEAEGLRVVTDPPADGAALTARLLTAPSLALELARRGVTVEVGVLAEAEFWSAYQPIVSLADRTVVAHEALLRGVVDGREVGGGDLFFVAERAGWLHRLDRIGRESAITGAEPWLGDQDLYVNFHPASVHRAQICLASTQRVVEESGIAPDRLVFEVVESHAIADRGHLVTVLEHFRSLGWKVALDDVGAGWSSLSLLAAVRPDVVKLDKRLVQELPDDGAQDRAEGRDRPGPPARRRRGGRGRGDRAAGRRGHRPGRRPRSGLAVRPPRPAATAGRGARGPVAAGSPPGGQRSPQPLRTSRSRSYWSTP
jgi:EAL domain-containing protein (putative c-di-GMP-specific phosphodiesterase class I)